MTITSGWRGGRILAILAAAGGALAVVRGGAAPGRVLAVGPADTVGLRGVWTAQPSTWKTTDGAGAVVVQLSLRRTRQGHESSSSFPVLLPDLGGLTREQVQAERADVRFTLARDAGTFACEGRFEAGEGAGHFVFTPGGEFTQALRGQGYGGLDDETVFRLAVHDVSRRFIADLGALGYTRLPLEELLNLRIHGADAEFVRELQALGYAHPSVEELVNLRIHGATAAYIREMASLGYGRLSVEQLVSLRIHGAGPDFVRALKDLGDAPLDPEGLVNMRIHGVTPEFIRALHDLGYDHLGVEDLVNMRIHGVTPDFIRRVNGRQGAPVAVERLVEMRIHGREE